MLVVQSGKTQYKWRKRGKRWVGPCMMTANCRGQMVINRATMIARCPVCSKTKAVQLKKGS